MDDADREADEIIRLVKRLWGHADLQQLVAERCRAIRRAGIERGTTATADALSGLFNTLHGRPPARSATIHKIKDAIR